MPGGAASGQQGRQRECGGGDGQGAARLETVDHVVPPKVGLPVAMTWEQSEWLREFAQVGKDFHVPGARLEWPNPSRRFRPGECRRDGLGHSSLAPGTWKSFPTWANSRNHSDCSHVIATGRPTFGGTT